jgi:hypothetical protein
LTGSILVGFDVLDEEEANGSHDEGQNPREHRVGYTLQEMNVHVLPEDVSWFRGSLKSPGACSMNHA